MNRPIPFRRRFAGAAALSLFAALTAVPALAQADDAASISVPTLPLGDALREFSVQAGVPVIFTEALVNGRSSSRVQGATSAEAALESLLNGTDLEAVSEAGGYIIRQKTNTPARRVEDDDRVALDPERAPSPIDTSGEEEETAELRAETVIVTGTSLRGLAPESSPLQIYSREDILGSGVTTTEQFIRTLPQNFGGGSSEFAPNGYPNDINSRSNNTFGTSANLRGLGSRGTLVLLNGNRTAPSSGTGDFVDISLIPVSAIERVDVLTDGASSIYGGDAVAGVINFILRDDFEGAETGLRFGTVTGGDMSERKFNQTFGTTWGTGNILGTYEYFDRENLSLADRPEIGLPLLTNGDPIPDADLFDLMPEQKRHSAVLSVRQEIGALMDVSAMGLYSRRDAFGSSILASGAGSLQNFDTRSESLSVSGGLDIRLAPGWFASSDVSFSQLDNHELRLFDFTSPDGPTTQFAESRSKIASIDAQLAGDLFPLWGGPVKAALGGHFRQEDFVTATQASGVTREADREVGAVFAELMLPLVGEENSVPGFRRLELNLSARADDYSDYGRNVSPKIGLFWSPLKDVKLRASYSESFAPPSLGRVGALDRTATVYPFEFILDRLGFALPDPSLAGVNYMLLGGTATDLSAEESRAFTTGFDVTRTSAGHEWSVSSTFYDIEFQDRLGAVPVPGNVNLNLAPEIAWNNPSAFPEGTISFFPTAAEIDAVLNSLSFPVRLNSGATLENVGVINRVNLTRNVATVRTSGIDVAATYGADVDVGRLTAGISGSYILDFMEQAGPSTPEVETLNTLYNPVDLKLRGSLGLSRGGFRAGAFVNYLDSYRTDSTPSAQPVDAWTTFDLNLSYAFAPSRGWLDETVLSLSALNLFDRAPPRTPSRGSSQISGYDPANASPLGRFIAIELRSQF